MLQSTPGYGNSAHVGDGCTQGLCISKKFELMLTRRAKAYSSSCSQTVSLSPD